MNKQEMQRFLSENAAYYYGLSDDVWDHPEVRFTEKHSSKVLADALAENTITHLSHDNPSRTR